MRVATVFEDSHAPLHKWASSRKGISSHQLHRILEVQYNTAWFMSHRIREAMLQKLRGPHPWPWLRSARIVQGSAPGITPPGAPTWAGNRLRQDHVGGGCPVPLPPMEINGRARRVNVRSGGWFRPTFALPGSLLGLLDRSRGDAVKEGSEDASIFAGAVLLRRLNELLALGAPLFDRLCLCHRASRWRPIVGDLRPHSGSQPVIRAVTWRKMIGRSGM